MDTTLPFVSIIIPVFNDSDRLKQCLHALEQQTYPKELYEVIVVDNNSEEDIQSVVQPFTQAKFAHESQQGSYAARNTGLAIAKGNLLGFTDSDCIPAVDWIEKGVQSLLKTANCGLLAGRINFYFQNPDHPTVAELHDSMTFLKQKQYIEEEHYGATANLFTFREVFDKVGRFNAQLKSGGDREWGKRVFAAGYTQVYADDVCIAHPARYSIQDLKKKVVRIVEGQYKSAETTPASLISITQEYLQSAKPSFRRIFEIFTDKDLKDIRYKVGFVYIHIVLRNVRAWKKLQLRLSK